MRSVEIYQWKTSKTTRNPDGSTLEPSIGSYDNGQWIACYDSCQLTQESGRTYNHVTTKVSRILLAMRLLSRSLSRFTDRAQKPQDMRTRALATVSCIPAFRFSKWRRTNQYLTRHCGRCQAAVVALRIFERC